MIDDQRRDRRGFAPGWIFFVGLCAVLLVGSLTYFGTFGVPGTTGGTSESQQQTSGAAQPKNDINTGRVQETTGYQPAPR